MAVTTRTPSGQRRPGGRAARHALIAITALATALVACGSKLDDARLQAANAGAGTGRGGQLPGSSSGSLPGPDSAAAGILGGRSTGEEVRPAGGGESASTTSPARGRGPAMKSEIRIGSFGQQSGIVGAALASVPPAIRAWVADVNARGGLNGHPLRLFMQDDGGDPGRALAIARRMAEEDKVLAFFGVHAALTQHAVTPYLEENGIPLIGGVQHADADSSPIYFRPGTGSQLGTYRVLVGTFVVQFPRVKRAAIINSAECGATCSDGATVVQQYGPKAGVEIVYRADVSIAQPDYTAEVISARNAGAEGVIMILDWPSAIRFIQSASRQGWHPPFAGSSSFHETGFADQAESDGVASFETVAPHGISPLMDPYVNAVNRHVPGGKMGGFGADVWVGGKLFERITPFLGAPPTRTQIFEGLYSLEGETLGGLVPPITFPRKGSRAKVNLCAAPIRVTKGKWIAPLGNGVFICGQDDGTITRVRV